MYDYIKGRVVSKATDHLVIDAHGIGYKLHASLATYHEVTLNDDISLYVHFYVKEDEHSLYGFSTQYERQVFSSIMSVSGIGPKLALKILAEIKAKNLIDTIVREDIESLKKIKGLGEKTSGKMILELKDKVNHLISEQSSEKVISQTSDVYNHTVEALKNLGYKDGEIRKVLKEVFSEKIPTLEEAIKKTLQALSKV